MFNALSLAVYTHHVKSRNIVGQRIPYRWGAIVTVLIVDYLPSLIQCMHPGLEIHLSEICPITLMGLVNLLIKDCISFLDLLVGRV